MILSNISRLKAELNIDKYNSRFISNNIVIPVALKNEFDYTSTSSIKNQNLDLNNSQISSSALKNENFKQRLKDKFQDRFLRYIKFNEINENYWSSIELELEQYFTENSLETLNWLFNLVIEFFEKKVVCINLVNIISKLELTNSSHTLTIAALLSHKDEELKEVAIRFYERLPNEKSLKILENVRMQPEWLEQYRLEVIEDIKNELGTKN